MKTRFASTGVQFLLRARIEACVVPIAVKCRSIRARRIMGMDLSWFSGVGSRCPMPHRSWSFRASRDCSSLSIAICVKRSLKLFQKSHRFLCTPWISNVMPINPHSTNHPNHHHPNHPSVSAPQPSPHHLTRLLALPAVSPQHPEYPSTAPL